MKSLVRKIKSVFGLKEASVAEALPFDLLFAHFREVLDSKNRAMEVIADMSDKLGGGYLFDITYVHNAYSELSAAMQDSLQLFEKLTRSRYAQLGDIFARIDRQIRLLVEGISPVGGDQVISYADITWDMARSVGGKSSGLAELKNYAKTNIPDGFAITTKAFDDFMEHNHLGGLIQAAADNSTSPGALSGIRDAIMKGEMPPTLSAAIDSALLKLRTRSARAGDQVFLAVRSSAEEEDNEYSFAGQFETVLNVPLTRKTVEEAYREVVASLYTPKAAAYQKSAGYDIGNAKMAVACLVMVDAMASGVAYSSDPSADGDTLIINATWGLGTSIVEGQTDADLYRIKKHPEFSVITKKIGNKSSMVTANAGGGTITVSVPDELVEQSSLADNQVHDVAEQAMLIEQYFRKPVDIEWAIDKEGAVVILQARPLRVIRNSDVRVTPPHSIVSGLKRLDQLLRNPGTVAQKGVVAGRVFILRRADELDSFPKGAILVARNDSSEFIRALPYASAIITDIGTPTSHMSSVCREFRVPTLVNTGDATKIFRQGQEITVVIEDDEDPQIYDGIIRELLQGGGTSGSMDDIFEFRRKRYILRYISPLNLIDPLMDNFRPDGCRTMHDILRFIHEKSVVELVDKARYDNDMVKRHAAIKLDLPVPIGIVVIDIGGGLTRDGNSDSVSIEQITSVPLLEIVRGITYPGVWRSEVTSLRVSDFLSSMMRMPDITSDSGDHVVYNIAVASKEYVNLSLRLGYHFNMIDCYCSENAKNNHIYFRFVGGATDMTKRSRRVQLLSDILLELGFNVNTKGDLIIGRLANLPQRDMEITLNQLGRLIGYTRQLDAQLLDDTKIEKYVRNFLEGNYEG